MKDFFNKHHVIATFVLVYVAAVVTFSNVLLHCGVGRSVPDRVLACSCILALVPAVLASMLEYRLSQWYWEEALSRFAYVIKYFLIVGLLTAASCLGLAYLTDVLVHMGGRLPVLLAAAYMGFWLWISWNTVGRLMRNFIGLRNAVVVASVIALLLLIMTIEPARNFFGNAVCRVQAWLGIFFPADCADEVLIGTCQWPLLFRMWNGVGRFMNLN